MATDNFTVNNFATNWSVLDGAWSTSGGRAIPQDTDGNLAYWSAQSWNNDQSASCKVYGTAKNGGPAVRVAATRCYYISAEPSQVRLFRLDSNENYNLIQDLGSTAADGDTFTIEVVGNQITCKKNGSQIGTTAADSTYTSGSTGTFAFANANNEQDDWEGLDIGGGGGTNHRWRSILLGVGCLSVGAERIHSRREALKRLAVMLLGR